MRASYNRALGVAKTLLTTGKGKGSCPWSVLTFVVTRRIIIHESHTLCEKFIKIKSRRRF